MRKTRENPAWGEVLDVELFKAPEALLCVVLVSLYLRLSAGVHCV